MEAEADDHHRVVGRRGMGPARIDRMGREAPAGARRPRRSPTSTATAPARAGSAWPARIRCRPSSTRSMRDVHDPRGSGKSVLEAKRERELSQAKTDAAKAKLQTRRLPDRRARIGLGLHRVSRSPDHRLAQPGLRRRRRRAAASTTRSTTRSTGTRTSPTATYAYGAALSRTIGTALLRLADADVLPFEFTGTATTLRRLRRRDREARRRDGKRRRSI